MTEDILLVEPPYPRTFLPMGLMKISTYHKNLGDIVTYTRDSSFWFVGGNYDKIYITSLFTWDLPIVVQTINSAKKRYPNADIKVGGLLATILPDEIKKRTGISPHIGLFHDVEHCKLDYSLCERIKYSFGFTSRGCIRKCQFCLVRKHEPDYSEIVDWYEQYYNDKARTNRFILMDNNFLAASDEHFKGVIDKVEEKKLSIDFNQGMDARLFTEEKAKEFARIRIEPIRFSFDSMAQDSDVQKAIDLCRKYDISTDISIYVLYNFKEGPEEIYYRMSEIARHGGNIFPMLYRDINAIDTKTLKGNGKWSTEQIDNFRRLGWYFRHYNRGIIFTRGIDSYINDFFERFGKNEKEFIDKLSRRPTKFIKVNMRGEKDESMERENKNDEYV